MKFCWWTPGPNAHETALLDALRALGHDVEVCYFHGKYGEYRLQLGWRDPELQPWEHYVSTLRDARRTIPDFNGRIQMVPTFFNLTSWKLLLWCTLRGRPWFAITEGTRGRWFMKPLFRTFCWFVNRYALKMFVEGGPTAQRQFIRFGVKASKVVPFAYATMIPRPAVPSAPSAVPNLPTTFVFAGEFCPRKAVDVIASCWKRLVAEYPASKLVLAGGGPMIWLFDGLPGVEYMGAVRQEDVYGVIMRGDVMLLPSRYDPWGAALVEGAMAGLAMVGSDRTGSADALVEDGRNGYVVRAGDETELLRVMRIYAGNRELAKEHGAAAKRAAARTTGDVLARRVVEALAR